MSSRRDYELIARLIAERVKEAPSESEAFQALRLLTLRFIEVYTAENLNFDRKKFVRACGFDQ
jgi:phosphate uptake regulator